MFDFFGTLNSGSERIQQAAKFIRRSLGDDVVLRNCVGSSVTLATTGDNEGATLGQAKNSTLQLIYIGAIWNPFPESFIGSPLDDPDKTAEALLKRYQTLGDEFLDDVVGNFAVCLVDGEDDRLVLARDACGGPRIYVNESGREVSFSTRLIDFSGPLNRAYGIDRSLEDFLLGFEFLPDDRTLVKNVSSIGRGKLVSWHAGCRNEREIESPKIDHSLLQSASSNEEDVVVDSLYEAFTESLENQCPSNGKIGVLQGGFDSMLITSVLVRMGREVETFTFRYPEKNYTQAMATELQQLLGTQHNWVDINPDVVLDGLTHFAQRFNQPVGQPHYLIASAEAAKAMKQRGIKHCLTGDGCDGLFLGYPTVFARARFIQRLSTIGWMAAPLIRMAGSSKWLETKIGHPYRFFRNIGRILERPMPVRGHIAACTLDQVALGFLRINQPKQEQDPEDILARLASGLDEVQPLRMAYQGKGRVGLNATKLEGVSRYSGVTFGSPYLHPRMSAVAERIPDDLNRPSETENTDTRANTGKFIFMRMVDKYELLPPEFVHQDKMSPVTSPIDLWVWGELRDAMLKQMEGLPFDVDKNYLRSLTSSKMAERWFRENVGISRQVTQAAGLLATYADFARHFEKDEADRAPRKA